MVVQVTHLGQVGVALGDEPAIELGSATGLVPAPRETLGRTWGREPLLSLGDSCWADGTSRGRGACTATHSGRTCRRGRSGADLGMTVGWRVRNWR